MVPRYRAGNSRCALSWAWLEYSSPVWLRTVECRGRVALHHLRQHQAQRTQTCPQPWRPCAIHRGRRMHFGGQVVLRTKCRRLTHLSHLHRAIQIAQLNVIMAVHPHKRRDGRGERRWSRAGRVTAGAGTAEVRARGRSLLVHDHLEPAHWLRVCLY
jgi:hypothetical protein